jgi:twitching motility protein PilT
LLQWCERRNATDLHVQAGRPLVIRIHGNLQRVPENTYNPLSQEAIYEWLGENFAPEVIDRIRGSTEADLSFYHGYQRYRANFSKQKGSQSFSFRIVPQQRQKLKELNLPDSIAELVKEPRGLILATGPTGQGKSTTLRALIQEINETQALRIVTIEDPIEYVARSALTLHPSPTGYATRCGRTQTSFSSAKFATRRAFTLPCRPLRRAISF